jgi:hypothetical protein
MRCRVSGLRVTCEPFLGTARETSEWFLTSAAAPSSTSHHLDRPLRRGRHLADLDEVDVLVFGSRGYGDVSSHLLRRACPVIVGPRIP